MKKIVELLIKLDELELGDTGVDIISLVENPAIQADFLYFATDTSELNPYVDQTGDKEFNESLSIFGYETQYFWICPGAIATFTHLQTMNPNEEVRGMIRSAAQIADNVFRIEALAIEKGSATPQELAEATLLVNDFTDLMKEIDELLGMSHDISYMPGHIQRINELVTGNGVATEKFQSYTDYPESAKKAAQRALDWAAKNGWGTCGTPVGKARANQLAKGQPISEDTIARMASFARHRQNSDTPYSEGCGGLMWDAWGGTAGIEWASNKLKKIREGKLSEYETWLVDELGKRGEVVPADSIFINAEKSLFSTLTDFLKGLTAIDIIGRRGVTQSDEEGVEVYRYAGPPAQRGFCQALQRLNRVYRRDEIESLNTANPGFGEGGSNSYSVFDYKGGVNCRHFWERLTMFRRGRDTVFVTEGSATGTAGQSNNAADPSPNGAVTNNARVNFSIDEEQKVVIGPAMVPNKLIKRTDEGGLPYHVYFTQQTIKDISEDFFAKANLNRTNTDHQEDTLTTSNTLLESWIVEDPQKDKSSLYGFDLPKGTWMVSYKINDDETWKRVKSGELKGFSVEGLFVEKAEAMRAKQMVKDQYDQIVELLNQVKS